MGTEAASGQAARFWSQAEERRNAILRHRAIGIPIVHAEDFPPHLERTDAFAQGRHHPGKLMRRNCPNARFPALTVGCGMPAQFRRHDARRVNLD